MIRQGIAQILEIFDKIPILLSLRHSPASAMFTACGSAKSSPLVGSPEVTVVEQYSKIIRHSLHCFCEVNQS